jgi:hypothetical protein
MFVVKVIVFNLIYVSLGMFHLNIYVSLGIFHLNIYV